MDELRVGLAGSAQERPHDAASTVSRRSLRLRSLVTLAWRLCRRVVPVWSYGLFVSWQYARFTRATIEADGLVTARGIANAVNFRVLALEGTLRSLSQSDALAKGDWAQLYGQAYAFGQAQDVVIGLADEEGQHIFNTIVPFGTALPPMPLQSRFREALDTGAVQISDMIYGSVSKTWLLALTRPR